MAQTTLDQALMAFGDLTIELGYPPSIREFTDRMGLFSSSAGARWLETMRDEGLVTKPAYGTNRTTVLTIAGRERYEELCAARQAVA